MATLEELSQEIEQLKKRNKLVEADKAWETSWTRKIIIFILTYFVITLFFIYAKLPKPFLNSVVPAIAYLLSNVSVLYLKKLWLKVVTK